MGIRQQQLLGRDPVPEHQRGSPALAARQQAELMGKKKLPKIRGIYNDPLAQATDGELKFNMEVTEGVGVEDGFDEEGHVLVVTQIGLAMLVAGLRSIKDESPEVLPLLETMETALHKAFVKRMDNVGN